MFCKLALRNVTRSLKDYAVYFLTLTFGVCIFYIFNSLESQWCMQMLARSAHYIVDSILIFMDVFSVFVSVVLADEPTGALDSKSAGQLLRQLSALNQEEGTTILMVTHDAFTASWCRRILFIKDGVLYRELHRGDLDRKAFFARILGVVSLLGGDSADVL